MPATAPFVDLTLAGTSPAQTVAINPDRVTTVRTNPIGLATSYVTVQNADTLDTYEVVGDSDAVTLALAGGAVTPSVGSVIGGGLYTGAGGTAFTMPGSVWSRNAVGDYLLQIANAAGFAGAVHVTLGDDPPVGSTCVGQQAAPSGTTGQWTVKTLDNLGAPVDPFGLNVNVIRVA